jgi:hypothetical protein
MMDAEMLRVARFLVPGKAEARLAAKSERLVLASRRGTIAVAADALGRMAARELVARQGREVALTETGIAFLRRNLNGKPDYQAQHRDLAQVAVKVGGELAPATVNMAESPLAVVARRKDRNGRPFLESEEFRAGERLRSDYTRGQLMPRLGANWQAAVSSGSHRGERGGVAELTEAALAARQRVENAIRAVGPELSGVLVDICCYLKGFETVERERGWPVRSAKIVLKSALAALARHYEPDAGRQASRRPVALHWGTADYRPNIK